MLHGSADLAIQTARLGLNYQVLTMARPIKTVSAVSGPAEIIRLSLSILRKHMRVTAMLQRFAQTQLELPCQSEPKSIFAERNIALFEASSASSRSLHRVGAHVVSFRRQPTPAPAAAASLTSVVACCPRRTIMAAVFSPNGGIRIKIRIGSATPKGRPRPIMTSRCSQTGTPSACEYMFNREWGMMVRFRMPIATSPPTPARPRRHGHSNLQFAGALAMSK